MSNPSMNTPNIQAYFSHSYRKEDRDINLFFWKLFHENGFFFAIDPKSSNPDDNLFNITYLERLMRSSDCFIAVVTVRKKKEGPGYTHSPYLAFENFLAELAEKPRLVFVEKGLDSSVFGFDHSDSIHIFERNKLENREDKIRDIVQEFSNSVTSYQSYSSLIQPLDTGNKAGILIQASPQSGYTEETIGLIKSQLKSCLNHRSELLQPNLNDGLQEFIRKLSEYDLVLMDVCDPSLTPDVWAIIQAKATPCVRLAKSASSETVERLKVKGILKDYFIGSDSPLILWEDDNDLQVKLEKYLNKFNQE
ncbi:MAG TPA: hypothetical protein VJ785_11205, partial [Anaerolineales bacterium]|nr:hypothetical protein [Anaerolineales bacterium]